MGRTTWRPLVRDRGWRIEMSHCCELNDCVPPSSYQRPTSLIVKKKKKEDMNIQDNFTNSGYTCYSVVDVIVGKILNFETNSTLQKIHKSAKNLFPLTPRIIREGSMWCPIIPEYFSAKTLSYITIKIRILTFICY